MAEPTDPRILALAVGAGERRRTPGTPDDLALIAHRRCTASPEDPCFHPSHRPGCQVTAPIGGTEVSVACERERGHHSRHTGVYDDERYSWPHHPKCCTQVGPPDLRDICDCRTLAMLAVAPDAQAGASSDE